MIFRLKCIKCVKWSPDQLRADTVWSPLIQIRSEISVGVSLSSSFYSKHLRDIVSGVSTPGCALQGIIKACTALRHRMVRSGVTARCVGRTNLLCFFPAHRSCSVRDVWAPFVFMLLWLSMNELLWRWSQMWNHTPTSAKTEAGSARHVRD